jgi:hypothetical protein
VLDWAVQTVGDVRTKLDPATLHMAIRAYRHLGDHLSVDLDDASGANVSITFHVDGRYGLGECDVGVPDLVEALHLAGLISDLLGVPATIGEPYRSVLVRSA